MNARKIKLFLFTKLHDPFKTENTVKKNCRIYSFPIESKIWNPNFKFPTYCLRFYYGEK